MRYDSGDRPGWRWGPATDPRPGRRVGMLAVRNVARVLASILVWLAAPQALNAQTVRGTVTAEASGAPLPEVRVTLMGERGDSAAASTNDHGAFLLTGAAAGRFRLRAEHLGYVTTLTDWFEVGAGHEVTVAVRLGQTAVPHEPLRVEARGLLPLHRAQIEERRHLGFGRFITREDIERRPGVHVAELLQDIPGVRVSNTGHSDLVIQIRSRSYLYIPQLPPLFERENAFLQFSPCPVIIYVDGVKLTRDFDYRSANVHDIRHQMDLNREFLEMSGADVDVIEVYSGAASVPGVFGGTDAECGVIALWRRRGGDFQVGETDAAAAVSPLAVHVTFAGGVHALRGDHAPDAGPVLAAAAVWHRSTRLAVTGSLRVSHHVLPAATAHDLTLGLYLSGWQAHGFVVPSGARTLRLVAVSVGPQLHLRPGRSVGPVVGAHVNLARRGFSIENRLAGRLATREDARLTSHGAGLGVRAGVDLNLSERLALQLGGIGDWTWFSAFGALERPDLTTAGAWTGASLSAGLSYRGRHR
jgi:hypothetical protein